MNKCKHCQQEVKKLPHVCEVAKKTFQQDDGNDFLMSLTVGMVTNNFALGNMLGGNVSGAIIGDLLNDGRLF